MRLLLAGFVLGLVLYMARDPLLRAAGRVIYPFPFRAYVEGAAASASVDPLLVIAVIREESGFTPDATSHAGAVGLMQVMPDTAAWVARRGRLPRGDLRDPAYNIRIGATYLGYLQRRYGGDLPRVLAAYNGGQGNVARWKDLSEAFPETRRYVSRGLTTYARYRWIYREHSSAPSGQTGGAAAADSPQRSGREASARPAGDGAPGAPSGYLGREPPMKRFQ